MKRVFASFAVALFAACGPVDLVVVDIPDAGDFQPPGKACASNDECLGGQYCSKPGGCNVSGTCRQRPLSCGGEHEPECGCDGITYFNSCLRRLAGVPKVSDGRCEAGLACDTATPCASGQYCAKIAFAPNECNGNISGSCWVLPDVACTAGPIAEPSFMPCGGGACLRVCDALKRQTPVLIRPPNLGPCP
ncbi:MAG: hypothetical protein QM817_26335 [Archangium sp.]